MSHRAYLTLIASGLFFCSAAQADMALTDLTKVDTSSMEQKGWVARKEAGRITLMCTSCQGGLVATDIKIGRAPDDTESRIRSGKTTSATMLDICKKNAVKTGTECFGMTKSDLKDGVGFVSDVSLGQMGFAATYTIWQDGKQLMIRNVAPSRKQAKANGALIFQEIAPQIVR